MWTQVHRDDPRARADAVHLAAVRESFERLLPAGGYRCYALWISAHPELASRWRQAAGVTQLMRLPDRVLEGLLDADEAAALLPYAALLTVAQMYEVISDDLAIGLASKATGDASFDARLTLIRRFTDVVLARLRGASSTEAHERLSALENDARGMSWVTQSTSEPEHRDLLAAFGRAHPAIDLADVEHGVIASLVANVEAMAALCDALSGCRTETLVRSGLIRRYRAVAATLDGGSRRPADHLAIAADAIMVIPAVGYIVGVLVEKVRPVRDRAALSAGGVLQMLEHAALLIRAMNDCGALVGLPDRQRDDVVKVLHRVAALGRSSTLGEVLWRAEREVPENLLTRLHKDLVFREFNVCLDGLRDLPATAHVVDAFAARLAFVSHAYQTNERTLHELTAQITSHLGTALIGEVVIRFIDFHRTAYEHGYDTREGDYAVPLSEGAVPGAAA